MTTLPVPLPFGLRDVKITPYTDLRATMLGVVTYQLPYSQVLRYSDVQNFKDVAGAYETLTNTSGDQSGAWALGAGGISLELLAALTGGSVVTTSLAPHRTRSFRRNVSNVRPFFQAVGQAMSDSGGDVHVTLYRCRLTGDITGEFGDGSFYVTSASGVFLPANTVVNDGDLYDVSQNERITSLPVAT